MVRGAGAQIDKRKVDKAVEREQEKRKADNL
jgi:hypothetical protein